GILLVAAEPGALNPSAALGRLLAPSKEHTPGEQPYIFWKYQKVIQKYFKVEETTYYFLVSHTLHVLAQKFPFTKSILQRMLKPILRLERFVAIPGLVQFYLITAGVYKKK